MLYLSVFFLLLAFFILLTSLSTFKKQKAEAVVAGIQDAFGRSGGDGDGGGAGLMAQAMARMSAVGQGVVAEIPGAVMTPPIPHGDRLAVSLPLDGLLVADGTAQRVADTHTALIEQIATALKTDGAAGDKATAPLPLSLEFLVGDGDRDDDDAPVLAAGAMARALVAAGAPVARMTVGVEHGRAGWGRFILSVKSTSAPAPTAEVQP